MHRLELGVADGGFDLFIVNLVAAFGKRRKQGFVSQNVDAAGQSLGGMADQLNGAGSKEIGAVVAGGADTEHEVAGYVASAQWFEREVVGNPLLELTHVHVAQALVQFRLAEEHNLQELVPVGFKVGEQADFFKRFRGHGMGFVDQDDDLLTRGVDFEQALLQIPQQKMNPSFGERCTQLLGNGEQNLVTR